MAPTHIADLLAKATKDLRAEAERLRTEIQSEEQALNDKLAPLRAQLAELDDAIARIEGKPTASGHATPTGRAPRGHNRKLILDYVETHPWATGVEVADGTNISKNTVYATLNKLVQDKELDRDTERPGGVAFRRIVK